MAEEMWIQKFLSDIIPVANSQVGEDELTNSFTKTISSIFGIDSVKINDLRKKSESNAVEGYIINTKKIYIDNQLSEYSAFPELINYKNRGFKSCALLPFIADGKVVSIVEMLSNSENKFNDDLVKSLSFGATFAGFVLMYKSEVVKNVRLANYFDAAFNNSYPQLIVSNDGSVIKYNKAAIKSFDISNQSVVKDVLQLDFNKLLALTNGIYANVVLSGGKSRGRVYSVAASKINDRMLHIIANDITDSFSYAAFNDIINNSKDVCVVLVGSDFDIRNISDNSESMFGYSKSLLVKGNFLDIVSVPQQNDFKKMLEGKTERYTGVLDLVFGNANQKHVRFLGKKFLDGYIFMLIQADKEKFVENIRSDLQDFINSSSDVVLTVDSLGYIKDCNIPVEAVLGYKKENMVGMDIKSVYGEQGILDRDINYVKNGGKVDNTFVNLVSSRSEPVPATHSIRLIGGSTDQEGPVYLIVIKELKTKMELERQKDMIMDTEGAAKRYKSESQLKSQFIYNMSHELKTPLTSIKGYSKLLLEEREGALNDEQKEFIKITIDESDRLLLVIQQILDAAKLESAMVKLELKEVDLTNLANNPSIKALEDLAKNKGLSFEWSVGYDVPKILADPNRLIQVFVNLIGNSIKFTEEGGIKVDITKKSKGSVMCSVIDTGIGISEEDMKKLRKQKKFFEVAEKKSLVQQKGAGSGLGLSITRDILVLHGGKRASLQIESKVGEGSKISFVLPLNPNAKKKKELQQNA